MRRVVTENSLWLFDLDLERYVRLPRDENPARFTEIAYTGEWEPYEQLEQNGDRIVVHRPVPWGTGARRRTGMIIEDDLTNS